MCVPRDEPRDHGVVNEGIGVEVVNVRHLQNQLDLWLTNQNLQYSHNSKNMGQSSVHEML